VARIQDPDDGLGHIWVRLSGSAATVRLDAAVEALIDEDIDQDGDLDLVATTAAGDLLIWLNDSHGRFTRQARQERSHMDGFTGEPVVVSTEFSEPVALFVTVPFIASCHHLETAVVATQVRPPTAPLAFDLGFLLLQTLRAPPSFSA